MDKETKATTLEAEMASLYSKFFPATEQEIKEFKEKAEKEIKEYEKWKNKKTFWKKIFIKKRAL